MNKNIILVSILLLCLTSFSHSLKTNYDFASAITLKVPNEVQFNNTLSPNSTLTICGEKFSSFMWYRIEPFLRLTVISISTCHSNFDTSIGVYTGATFDDLKLQACNDDLFTVRAIDDCNPYASFISSVYIPAGEPVYIAIGGYLNPNTHIPSRGFGTFTLDFGCFPYFIYEKELTFESLSQIVILDAKEIVANLSDISSSMSSNIDSFRSDSLQSLNNFQVQLPVQTFQSISDTLAGIDLSSIPSSVNTLQNHLESVSNAVVPLDDDSQRVANSLDTFYSNLMNDFSSLTTRISDIVFAYDNYLGIISLHRYQIEDFLGELNATLITQREVFRDSTGSFNNQLIAQHTNIINSIDQKFVQTMNSVNLLKNRLQSTVQSINDQMTVLTNNVDQVTSDINAANDTMTQISNRITSMNAQLDAISLTMSSIQSNLDLSFQSLSQSCSQIVNNLNSTKNAIIGSFPTLTNKIGELDSSADSLKQSVDDTISLLNNGAVFNYFENEMDPIFINTVVIYLHDTSIEYPPLHLRIPNRFGGRMDDVLYLIETGQVLVQEELAKRNNIDTHTYNLVHGPQVTEYVTKYRSLVAEMRFKEAYAQLQGAYISLYPDTCDPCTSYFPDYTSSTFNEYSSSSNNNHPGDSSTSNYHQGNNDHSSNAMLLTYSVVLFVIACICL